MLNNIKNNLQFPALRRRILSVLCLFICCSYSLSLQAFQKTPFLTSLKDQSDNKIKNTRNMHKGPMGFYWLGGDEGIYRFDGVEKIRIHDHPTRKIFFDSRNRLWSAGTTQLIKLHSRHLSSSENQSTFYPLRELNSGETRHELIRSHLFWSGVGEVFVSNLGLKFYQETEDTFLQVTITNNGQKIGELQSINTVNGSLVIGTENGFILVSESDFKALSTLILGNKKDIKRDLFENGFRFNLTSSQKILEGVLVRKVIPIPNGFAVASNAGIFILNQRLEVVEQYTSNNPSLLSPKLLVGLVGDDVNDIEIFNYKLWVATTSGASAIDLTTKEITNLSVDESRKGSLDNNLVSDIYADKESLALVTYSGINVFYPNRLLIENLSGAYSSEVINNAWSFASDDLSNIYVGTFGSGLFHIENGEQHSHRVDSNTAYPLASNRIASLYFDDLRRLWVGTTKGLQLKLTEKEFVKPFESTVPDLKINRETIMDIKQDSHGDLWIASNTALTYVSKDLKTTREYLRGDKSGFNSSQWVRSLMPIGESAVLVGTDLGLFRWDRNKRRADLLKDEFVIKLFKDTNGKIRVLTRGHLYQYDGIEKYLTTVAIPDYVTAKGASEEGRGINQCNGITEDQLKQIWLICNNTLIAFDSESNVVKNVFNLTEQIDLSNFLTGEHSFVKLNGGELALGMRSGAYTFLPQKIGSNFESFKPKLSRVNVKYNDAQTKTVQLLNHSAQQPDEQSYLLNSDLHRINFHFTHLSLLPAADFDFEYRLAGYEDNWLPLKPAQYSVEYNGLSFGAYRFELRARYKTSQWKQADFLFEIAKPIWLSVWAYCIYALLLIGAFWLILQWRTQKLKSQSHKLSQLVTEKTRNLENSRREIERLLISKEQLVEQIYHKTKTPLQLLVGYLNQFERKETSMEEFVAKQKGIIMELSQLTEQALKIAEHDYVPSKTIEKFNVASCLTTTILCLQESAEQKSLDLNIEIGESITVLMDPGDLVLLVQNLIENAIKYTEHGKVDFRIESLNQELIIICKDTGIGIPGNEQLLVLERYKRGSNVLNREGDGIGLAVVNLIVKNLQGDLKISSNGSVNGKDNDDVYGDINDNDSGDSSSAAQGCHFTIRLPVCSSESDSINNSGSVPTETIEAFFEPETEPEPGSEPRRSRKRADGTKLKTILIVEDNVELSAYLKSIFKRQYKILSCLSVASGFAKALSQVPDLIISDIMLDQNHSLDKLDGFDFIKQIRHDRVTDHIPMIMVTAKSDSDSREKAMQLGANDYITKPFDESILIERVNNLLCLFDRVGQKSQKHINVTQESPKDRVITSFIDLVTKEFSDPELTVTQMSEKLHVSNRQLERKCRVMLSSTPKEYLNNFRLMNARKLIRKGASVKQTIEACGFSSASYFSRKYKQSFNISPSDDCKKAAAKVTL